MKYNAESGAVVETKQKFEDRYRDLLDDEFDEFMSCSLKFLRRGIRVNTLKISVKDCVKRLSKDWNLTPVPWCKEGFWIDFKGEEKRYDIGNWNEHVLGYIYVQEPASMIPPIVLDVKPDETVLDMAASPGSKTTQMAAMMENKGVLVANDAKGVRLASLDINLMRMGVTNCITTLMKGQQYKNYSFDKILLDAPCSGTGTIRKSLKTLTSWNPNVIKKLSGLQKSLFDAAYSSLKKNGVMVYSTCSLEPEENEKIISDMLQKYPDLEILDIDLDIKRSSAVMEFEGEKFDPRVSKCLRIYPQDNDTEGFFVAKLKKK